MIGTDTLPASRTPEGASFTVARHQIRRVRVITLLLALVATALALGVTSTLYGTAVPWSRTMVLFFAGSWGLALCAWIGTLAILIFTATLLQTLDALSQQDRYARQLDDLKDQFIASVNHEMRNPVMAMMGYLDIISVSLRQDKTERLTDHVTSAVQAGYALRTLITGILDTSRYDQQTPKAVPAAVDVRAIVDTSLTLVGPEATSLAQREVQVEIPPQLAIWGEAVWLQEILTNLLSNACKYSPPGTPIAISARIIQARKTGSRRRPQPVVEIVVRDYGLGIPPSQMPLLFRRFVRLPRDLASTTIGNGLGLYLCKVLAEAMSGQIWAESAGVVGEGTAFHLHLPAPPGIAGVTARGKPGLGAQPKAALEITSNTSV